MEMGVPLRFKPFISSYSGLLQYFGKKVWRNIGFVGVWNRENQISSDHVRMSPSVIWPIEAELPQLPDKLAPLDRTQLT